MKPDEWQKRTVAVFRDLDSLELPDAAYQCALYAADAVHPLHAARAAAAAQRAIRIPIRGRG